MKISTKGRYGLRALIDVAAQENAGCVTLKSIATRLGLSEAYLEQIFAALKRGGFVRSVRGARGGYSLSCLPEETSVAHVLRALEGSLYPVDCLSDADKAACGSVGCASCVARPVWEKMYNSMNDVLESMSLASLVKDYRGDEGNGA